MFHSARLKLTAWYLLIIMSISGVFSMVIYRGLTLELERMARRQFLRRDFMQMMPWTTPPVIQFDPVIFEESKERIQLILLAINAGIFIVAGGAGYFLAVRTLAPIQDIVYEQNRFIADASHELRTPLTALKTATEVNLRDKNLTLSQAKGILKDNLSEINNMQILSDNLLRLAQFEQGDHTKSIREVSIRYILKQAIKKVQHQSKAKEIKINITGKDYYLKGNQSSLTELFIILFDNAVKYSTLKSKIAVTTDKTSGFIEIVVSDHGIGIDKKDIPYIFDRFYRSDKSRTKDEEPGYGLGLAIAKKIVSAHNGSITVKSKLKQGTAFTIKLPVS